MTVSVSDTTALPEALRDKLLAATSIGVVTGAGVSAASGIRTYRGQGGLYDDPEEGERTVEALSGPTLRADPDRTWRVVADLALMARNAAPNPAHLALVEIEAAIERFTLLTQNVDGLHDLAGSRNIIDIHGSLHRCLCQECGATQGEPDWETLETAPRCLCGGIARPDVVLFEEMLPEDKLQRLHREFIFNPPDVLIVAGTTAMFPYISMPEQAARHSGKTTIEVNPDTTVLSDFVHYRFPLGADVVLPAIAALLRGTSGR